MIDNTMKISLIKKSTMKLSPCNNFLDRDYGFSLFTWFCFGFLRKDFKLEYYLTNSKKN
jgi:hypothetical protein